MKFKKYEILLILVVLTIIATLVGGYLIMKQKNNTGNGEETFSGIVQKAYFGCRLDAGSCLVVIKGKTIVIGLGGYVPARKPQLWGDAQEIFDNSENIIGKQVSVFAKKTEKNYYTLEGNKSYYIKIVR